jgi:23S rRNA-/tRNA-specific pseudouridylate synthase
VPSYALPGAQALNAVIAAQEGFTYADADVLVTLGAALVRKSPDEPWRRLKEHTVLEADSWLKFYPQPQRFSACDQDWKERVLHMCDKYVIVDKPPDLPCQGVESNARETAPNCAARGLGLSSLILAHRLDSCASGALVLARTRAAQSLFTRLQTDGSTKAPPGGVQKEYRALVKTPLSADLMGSTVTHYMAPVSRGPALLRASAVADGSWKKCVLQILSCTPAHVHPTHLTEVEAAGQEGGFFEVRIRLVTGRRHQIRAQLSALGSPIWRDTLYEPLAGLTLDVENMEEAGAEKCMERIDVAVGAPAYPKRIALQAMRITLLDIDVSAQTPWWLRQQDEDGDATAS